MLRWLKKKQHQQARWAIHPKIRNGFYYFWNSARKLFVHYLSEKAAHLSAAHLKKYLLLFCMVSSMVSLYIFLHPFFSPTASIPVQDIRIVAPGSPDHLFRSLQRKDSMVTHQKYQRVLQYEAYLDSIRFSVGGRRLYDSLLSTYPGLLDSIVLLKKMYQNQ